MTESEIKFAQEQIELAKHLQSMSRKDEIDELCSMNGCDDRLRRVHARQFLESRWNPHPSERFVRWWMNRGWSETEEATLRGWSTFDDRAQTQRPVKAVQAYNCEVVREVYRKFLAEQRAEINGL